MLNFRPDREVYLVALRELGLPGDECLAFEDSAVGLRAAVGAGISTVVTPPAIRISVLLAMTPGMFRSFVLAFDLGAA